jgi:hypothetical protein
MNGLLAAAILSYFASTVFVKIWNSKWDHSTLKYVALTCILVSVLTSYFVFTQIIINSQPASVDINAYRHLAKNTPANSVILSMPSQGGFIYYFTGRSPYISDIRQNSVYENRSKTFNEILASKSLDTTVALLRNSSINYIMINPRFASSNQWREDNGGLALMLRNRHAFTPTYQGDYLIYKVNDDFNISSNS